MISDILTVMWKERKGLFRQRGSRIRAALTMLVPVIMIVIFLPFQIAEDWYNGYFSLIAAFIVPLLLVGTQIPESFAGERERHTLGTLLASRLPDRAILFGKMGLVVLYAWVVTIIALLLSIVTVNIAHWTGQVVFFTPIVALANIIISLLLAGMMASLGILISLRSSTVQGATQALLGITLTPIILLQIAGLVVIEIRRDWLDSIIEMFSAIEPLYTILIVVAVLLLIFIVLFWIVMLQFRRDRLILN